MDDAAQKQLLTALARSGDSANLYQVAEEIGLDRDQAQDMGTNLMAEGLLEMVNLSGSVRVTEAGKLMTGGGSGGADSLAALVADLDSAGDLDLAARAAADAAQDIACLKAQLKRSTPLAGVTSACLAELERALSQAGGPKASGLAARARTLRKA